MASPATLYKEDTYKMRFETTYEKYKGEGLTQSDAAELLGISDRTLRRTKSDAYRSVCGS